MMKICEEWQSEMVKNLLLSLFLVLTACSKMESYVAPQTTVDPRFLPWIEEYRTDKFRFTGLDNIRPLNIIFFSTSYNSTVIGTCDYNGDVRTITIDPEYWFNSDLTDRRILFYHEMGHCDLDIYNHNDGDIGIMNSYAMDSWEFNLDPEYYLYKFFVEGK